MMYHLGSGHVRAKNNPFMVHRGCQKVRQKLEFYATPGVGNAGSPLRSAKSNTVMEWLNVELF